jgi:para-nitrobenzyl esterase
MKDSGRTRDVKQRVVMGVTCLLACAWSSVAAAQTVATPSGTFPAASYQGIAESSVEVFRGIRFAAAPTGQLRWAPPVAPAAEEGPIDATHFGSACPQLASPFGVASTNEDCLFLNVYTPANASRAPVMVFFYGGAFVSGASDLYDAAELARQGSAVVVTVNYRLGELGYMASPELSRSAPNKVSGNYGLLDQQFALKWVRQNVAAFGGDAGNVTVFGESAGAFSICALLVAPSAAGLFDRAIMESGPCAFPFPTLAAAEAGGTSFTEQAGCSGAADPLACLRALSTQDVLDKQPSSADLLASPAGLTAFFPNVDGAVFPQQPETALTSGEYTHVPVLEGTNADEGRLFVALTYDLARGTPLTSDEYPQKVNATAAVFAQQKPGADGSTAQLIAQQIMAEYPLNSYTSPSEALASVIGDGTFSCPALITHELFSLNVATFAYEFADRSVHTSVVPAASFSYGATHTDELQFLFDVPGVAPQLSSDEGQLATTMKAYWSRFALGGRPAAGLLGLPAWLPFSIAAPTVQSLVAPTPSTDLGFSANHHCTFWEGILLQSAVLSALTAAGG